MPQPLPQGLDDFASTVAGRPRENRGWSLDFTYATRELVIAATDTGDSITITVPPGVGKHDVLEWQERVIQLAQSRRAR